MNDSQLPPDGNGVFDGESFKDEEFAHFVRSRETYPKIRLMHKDPVYMANWIESRCKKQGIELAYRFLNGNILEVELC